MNNKNKYFLQIISPFVLIFIFVFSLQFIVAPTHVNAIVCADGSYLPTEQAANCPTASGSAPQQSTSFCSQNPDQCSGINPGGLTNSSTGSDGKQCGKGSDAVTLSINVGCRGESYPSAGEVNPIIDMAFALLRFLSAGVGLVVIGSIVVAGIQYSSSRGNPQATEAAIKRVTNSVLALLLYIFIFAIANYLIPGGMLI